MAASPNPELPGLLQQLTANEQQFFYHGGDGLHYLLDEIHQDYVLLRCLKTSCPGTAFWQSGSTTLLHAHNHLPNPLFPSQLQLRKRILQRTRNGCPASYSSIFEEESSLFSRAVQAKVKWELIYPEMKCARLSLAPLSESLQEVATVFQQSQFSFLAATLDAEDSMFSKLVSGADQSSSLILCSARNVSFLDRVKSLICVTEHVANLNLQLLVLVGMFSGHAFPLVYCLMERQSISSYEAILRHLREINSRLDPDLIISPYDSALKEAWNSVYPRAETVDQLHHQFIKAIFQFISAMPIVVANFKTIVALCCAVPLVPHVHLHEAFIYVTEEAMQDNNFEDILPLLDYIWETWLTGRRYDEEAVSVSHHELCWSNVGVVFRTMMKKIKLFSCPNVFFVVGAFAELEETIKSDILQLEEGKRITPSRRLTTSLHLRLLLDELHDGTLTTEGFMAQILPSVRADLEPYF